MSNHFCGAPLFNIINVTKTMKKFNSRNILNLTQIYIICYLLNAYVNPLILKLNNLTHNIEMS